MATTSELNTQTREDAVEDEQDVQNDGPSLADDPDMPQPGDLIGGRYEVQGVIGEGGFAAVYKCHDQRTGQDFAIKVLDPMMSRRSEFSARFLREIRTVSKLRHHNTIKVTDAGKTDNGCLYLVMELLDGEALDEILDRDGALTPLRVQRIMSQVLKSLIEAHQDGVMHRDMKPGNVFIAEIPGEVDYVKVLDFGIAKSRDDAADTSLTATGQVMCSPDYVAPERVRDHVCFFSSDLYSLGIMMIEMLEGELPYKGDTPIMVALQHARTDSDVPIKNFILEGPLGPVVQKAVNKDASKRYQSAEEMLAALVAVDASGVPAYDSSMALATPTGGAKTTYLSGGETVTDLGVTEDALAAEEDENSRRPLIIFLALALLILIAGGVTVMITMNDKANIEAAQKAADEEMRLERAAKAEAAAAERAAADEEAAAVEDTPAPVLPSILMVNASPQGAYVYVNDKREGSTPYGLSSAQLPDFPITIRLDGEELVPQEHVFETPEELADATLSFTLERVEKAPEPTRSRRSSSRSKSSSSSKESSSSKPSTNNAERSASTSSSSSSKSSNNNNSKSKAEEEPSRRPRIAPISPRFD